MLNNHEVNLTDEEAAAEVARVAKTYPVVRLLSADRLRASLTACSPAIGALVCVNRVLRPWQIPMRCRSNCSTMVLSTAPAYAL